MFAGKADNLRMVSEKYLKCFVLTIPFHIILSFKRIVLLAGCHSSKSSRLSNSITLWILFIIAQMRVFLRRHFATTIRIRYNFSPIQRFRIIKQF